MNWTEVATLDELFDGASIAVRAGTLELALHTVGGVPYATDNRCSHAEARLCEGFLEGHEIECPLHQGRFDVRTGEATCAPATEKIGAYPARIEAGKVFVLLPLPSGEGAGRPAPQPAHPTADGELEHRSLDTGSGSTHYVVAGSGEPLVLLHGWPHTWFAWRHVIPLLADRFRVVAPDLRGLGDSQYAGDDFRKTALASDVARVLEAEFGAAAVNVVGHDWGGPVAMALALSHRARAKRLVIVDVVIPGDGRAAGMAQGGQRWHHAFHRTRDLPEALTAGRERAYLHWFFGEYSQSGVARTDEALDAYARAYAKPGAMKNGFELYRAIPRDAEEFARALAEGGTLRIPVHCVSGACGRGRGAETLESVARFAPHATAHVIDDCGHCVPEEKPAELAAQLRAFLA